MRAMGLEGISRGKPIRTTVSNRAAPCPLDHVNRQFHAPAPNMLWVSDFTYVATWTRLRLRGFRHRHLRSKDRGLAGEPDGACGAVLDQRKEDSRQQTGHSYSQTRFKGWFSATIALLW